MSNFFVFGDVDTRDFNVHVFDMNTDYSPQSLNEGIVIPGKNGRLMMLNNYFDNVEHRYIGVIYEDAEHYFPLFRDAILGQSGYQRLEDNIHLEEFYQAQYNGGLEPTLTPGRGMVKFVIEFSRKPQRYLLSGQEETVLSSSGEEFINPSTMVANPLIKVAGNGTVTVGNCVVTITPHSRPFIMIDSEMKDCYYSSYNCNSLVTFSNYDFPVLGKGQTTISYSSGISSVSVVPRWWRA